MKRAIIAALAAAIATPSFGQECTGVPAETLGQNLKNRLLYTSSVGFDGYNYAYDQFGYPKRYESQVTVTLSEVLRTEWECASWSVTLHMPPGIGLVTGTGHESNTATRTGLGPTDEVTFFVDFEITNKDLAQHHEPAEEFHLLVHPEFREYRGFLEITISQESAGEDAVMVDGVTDSQGRYHVPIRFRAKRGGYG